MCSVGKKYVLRASELFKIRFEFMLHTSIDACIAVGVVLLLVLVLLSLLIAKNESLLVLPLALALLLQLILILVLVVAPVRVSILVLRPIPILESKIDIGTVPAVVPILLIPTSARVDVLSLAVVQRPVLAIEPVSVRGLAWEKKLHWCRQWCWQLHKSWDMCYYWY